MISCIFIYLKAKKSSKFSDKESIEVILRESLLSVLRVVINLAHDYSGKPYGSLVMGQQDGEAFKSHKIHNLQ